MITRSEADENRRYTTNLSSARSRFVSLPRSMPIFSNASLSVLLRSPDDFAANGSIPSFTPITKMTFCPSTLAFSADTTETISSFCGGARNLFCLTIRVNSSANSDGSVISSPRTSATVLKASMIQFQRRSSSEAVSVIPLFLYSAIRPVTLFMTLCSSRNS